jgi:hypothetical protein
MVQVGKTVPTSRGHYAPGNRGLKQELWLSMNTTVNGRGYITTGPRHKENELQDANLELYHGDDTDILD